MPTSAPKYLSNRLLLKSRGGARGFRLNLRSEEFGLADGTIEFSSEPLFKSIGGEANGAQRARGLSAAQGSGWCLATSKEDMAEVNAWDLCHALLKENAQLEFAEPDIEQQWLVEPHRPPTAGMGVGPGWPEQPQDIGNGYSGDPNNNYWFRDGAHSQFDDPSVKALGDPGEGRRVRIAHLDTGYDPNHAQKPLHLNAASQ